MIACCPDGCVVCEVDGLPMDAQRAAERQEVDRRGSEAFERTIAALGRPRAATEASATTEAPRLTARERGAARRARIAAEAAAEAYSGGLTWTLHTTGFMDRRDTNLANRQRSGRAAGLRKKPRTGRDL